MGRSRAKNKGASSSSNQFEIAADEDFTSWSPPPGYSVPIVEPSYVAATMRTEPHPWLQFRDVGKNERVIFTNKLAEIQHYPVEPPRTIDWELLGTLGIHEEISAMLMAEATYNSESISYDMWERIFTLNRPVYREWCLEFYSTLRVDRDLRQRDIGSRKVIHFRLGGKQRHCTVVQFAYLTGMMTREELSEEAGHYFIWNGVWDTTGFTDNMTFQDYWTQLSGNTSHSSATSKVADIRSTLLRVFHKMLTYSFLHRSNQNDKVYPDDLWLLRMFSEGAPTTYACAPYVLARYMQKHNERKLLCGHFITKMVERLGLSDTPDNRRHCSLPVQMLTIGRNDLRASRLLTPTGTNLIEDGAPPPPPARRRRRTETVAPEEVQQEAPMPPNYDFSAWGGQLQEILDLQRDTRDRLSRVEEQQFYYGEEQRHYGREIERVRYTQDYYQPFMQRWVDRDMQQNPDEAFHHMPPYAPPEPYTPQAPVGGYQYPRYGYPSQPPPHQGGESSSQQRPVDLYGSELFAEWHHGPGTGTPSIHPPPGDMDF